MLILFTRLFTRFWRNNVQLPILLSRYKNHATYCCGKFIWEKFIHRDKFRTNLSAVFHRDKFFPDKFVHNNRTIFPKNQENLKIKIFPLQNG